MDKKAKDAFGEQIALAQQVAIFRTRVELLDFLIDAFSRAKSIKDVQKILKVYADQQRLNLVDFEDKLAHNTSTLKKEVL